MDLQQRIQLPGSKLFINKVHLEAAFLSVTGKWAEKSQGFFSFAATDKTDCLWRKYDGGVAGPSSWVPLCVCVWIEESAEGTGHTLCEPLSQARRPGWVCSPVSACWLAPHGCECRVRNGMWSDNWSKVPAPRTKKKKTYCVFFCWLHLTFTIVIESWMLTNCLMMEKKVSCLTNCDTYSIYLNLLKIILLKKKTPNIF